MDGWMKDAGCWMVGKTEDWWTEDRRPEDCQTAQRPRSEDWFCDPQIVVSQLRFNVAHIIHSVRFYYFMFVLFVILTR